MTKTCLLFILALVLQACSSNKPGASVVYSVDKEGLYLFDPGTGETKKLMDFGHEFMPNTLEHKTDRMLAIVYQSPETQSEKKRAVYSKYLYKADGDSTFITDNPPYTTTDRISEWTETEYHIDLSRKRHSAMSQVCYRLCNDSLKIEWWNINCRRVKEKDTLVLHPRVIYSSQGRVADHKGRFYTESVKGNKKVFTRRGDLYLVESGRERVLLKSDVGFDPKFGAGYLYATLSPDGKRVAYYYAAGFLKPGSGLFELDIKTGKKTRLLYEGYSGALYSPDGQFLLVRGTGHKKQNGVWVYDLYIYEIATGRTIFVGAGDQYVWV